MNRSQSSWLADMDENLDSTRVVREPLTKQLVRRYERKSWFDSSCSRTAHKATGPQWENHHTDCPGITPFGVPGFTPSAEVTENEIEQCNY
ncbi:hypothetical protein AVEN_43006-1 [Araneus ventricosus]|uniref:Uncharacterized protein n=1 Tax=Araneus ventricosus TaxID=182803 RepID=A0A4Y2T7A5_ARAVE|nr:hypothetical protein AVEN_43006-1 [Araneus ventricosus]